jgi:hypothetical protein
MFRGGQFWTPIPRSGGQNCTPINSHVDEQARYRANSARGGDIAARALGALSGRGDHSHHPRSDRRRYSTDRHARSRNSVWLALSHQRNRRFDHHLPDAPSAGFLVVARLGDPWNCGRYRAAVVAVERRPLAYVCSHRVFRNRRRCLDNVRATSASCRDDGVGCWRAASST